MEQITASTEQPDSAGSTMVTPTFKTKVYSKADEVSYEILAYRQLTREEAVNVVTKFRANHSKVMQPGDSLRIPTHIR